MCQLKIKGADTDVTRNLIVEQVDQVLSICPLSDSERSKLIKELEERFTVWTETARVLCNNDDHEEWLQGRRGSITWKFWDRYRLHLSEKLPQAAVDSIEDVTDKILRNLENPNRDGPWDRRGLVMGNVQSGKTANYTGLTCKAADAGYKVIIVLAGMHNNLRSQTQIRLDEGFLGYKASPGNDGDGAFEPTGVGHIDPSPRADSVTNRNEKGDFSKKLADHFAIHPGGNPLLFVVKKNASVLKNLLSWIRGSAGMTDPATGSKFHTDVPLLVIDDEADQASVDTREIPRKENGDLDEDHDPTRINKLIRQLLYAFTKSAYVGYTATPFANIYIFEHGKTNDAGSDLFPGSFIINIPPPSNYIGAAQVFGIQEDEDSGLEEIEPLPITRIVDDYAQKRDKDGNPDKESGYIHDIETEGWMPPRLIQSTAHTPQYEGERMLPPSLQTAIKSFILATAVRKIREGSGQHNSMLIHVVRFTLVQREVTLQVEAALNQIKSRLQNGDGDLKPTIIEEFEALWYNDFIPTSESCAFEREPFCGELSLPDWPSVKGELWNAVSSIEVMTINGSAADALNYEDHNAHGLNVIVIGGDKLSRGLTLEGLTVSYFLRASKMYDTLMQMGRWFGYRSKYADVCRLYTSEELISWFAHIALASEELRQEFDYMFNVGGTPRNYGHKVRSHPLLLVTSRVKMRGGVNLSLSFAGNISETIIYHTERRIIDKNMNCVSDWLRGLGSPMEGSGLAEGYMWHQVDAEAVVSFLGSYETHEDASKVKTDLLATYINRQLKQGELTKWSVLLVSSALAQNRYNIEGIGELGLIERSHSPNSKLDSKRYVIRRLLNPIDEAKDLTKSERDHALSQTQLSWEKSTRKNKSNNPPNRPGGHEIRSIRSKERGFLLIYPLDHILAGIDSDVPIMGIAMSFPDSKTAVEIGYTVNQTFYNAEEFDFS